ncbi:MAG: SDR family oxidoreductase [Candidatus Aminicenantes bacterium]|nr:MAG: SDR family oxidoreductase [Candidatus Aminicenantes bacterium]
MKVLLTGATGYIGRRLKERLIEDENIQLRLFVRNERKVRDKYRDQLEIYEGSTFDRESLRKALEAVDVAYYLIHSMGARGDFEKLDRLSAENFLGACIAENVQRIIYLGGLGRKETASKHLLSRIETGEILSSRPDSIQTIWFRAGIIIGSGSASFEIIRNLVQNLPLMITPRRVHTKTQPISVINVLEYLFQAKDLDTEKNLVVDIGSEQMSFKEMLLRASKIMGLRRILIPVPLLSPRLSSYWLILMTPVSYRIARALVEGLKSETVIQNDNAKRYFPRIFLLSYKDAIKAALADMEKNEVISRWCDSSAEEACDTKDQDRIEAAVFVDKKFYDFGEIPSEIIFASVQSIGGENGWFRYDWLWRLRGSTDKLVGGPGLNRGRRDPLTLRVGDSLDFWKIVDLKKDKRLLLFSQMKAPGKAWLEFSVDDTVLVQTVYFLPKGLWGRLYWYLIKPFYILIFSDLAKGIIKQAKALF